VPPVCLFHGFSLVIQGVYIAWREKSNLLTTRPKHHCRITRT